ncbi:MAG: hypothetical protein NC041_07135 [Bacteroides sp.]|nr:hypothetical protein [Prevotella sp.]MCM1407071.1 hypothetical protein [Treponema brennaborense]MCM1470223.1 hypothetical protein [Bacteroides sp.]
MDLVALSAEAKLKRKQEINARFLEEGERYNLNLCLEKAKMYQDQMASGLLGLGAQLLLLKANEEHGNFVAAVESLGLAYRSASYAMSAALKFGNVQTSAHLVELGKEKLRALTVLDDDQAQDLVNGGEVEGLGNLDDVAQMTVRELRKTLREVRSERAKMQEDHEKAIKAVEEVVRKKESKISELEMEVAGRQPPTKEELAARSLDGIRVKMMRELAAANDAVNRLREFVDEAQNVDGVNLDQLDGLVEQVSDIYTLLDSSYTEFTQDMENIRPARKEE